MNTFQTAWPGFYGYTREALAELLSTCGLTNPKVLDIGANNGTALDLITQHLPGATVTCVDLNQAALASIQAPEGITVQTICSDATAFLHTAEAASADILMSVASLHEIWQGSHEEYLTLFFAEATRLLRPGGWLFVADHYYPTYISDEVVERHRAEMLAAINHADSRDRFIDPEVIEAAGVMSGLILTFARSVYDQNTHPRKAGVLIFRKE